MPEAPRRKFALSDAMALVAATAIGLSAWRWLQSLPIFTNFPDSLMRFYAQALATSALLTPISLALLGLALRRPRPLLRRMGRDPALVLGLSVSVVFVVNAASLLTIMALVGPSGARFIDGKVLYFCRGLSEQVGTALACFCVAQAVVGGLRRPRTWLDGFAWAIGLCWFALAVVAALWTFL